SSHAEAWLVPISAQGGCAPQQIIPTREQEREATPHPGAGFCTRCIRGCTSTPTAPSERRGALPPRAPPPRTAPHPPPRAPAPLTDGRVGAELLVPRMDGQQRIAATLRPGRGDERALEGGQPGQGGAAWSTWRCGTGQRPSSI